MLFYTGSQLNIQPHRRNSDNCRKFPVIMGGIKITNLWASSVSMTQPQRECIVAGTVVR